MNKIQNNLHGWVVYSEKVKELIGRQLTKAEYQDALMAYIKPITAEAFAEKLTSK